MDKNQNTKEPNDAAQRLSNIKFSTSNYSKYIKMEQQRKSIAQTKLKGLVDQITDKNNWK